MRRSRPSLNLTDQLETVIADLCRQLPAFAHIDPRRVLVCVARSRQTRPGGMYAKIVPMRFPNGSPLKQVKGHWFSLPQIPTLSGDVLYLIYVYLPRFFTQPPERRLLTLIHELYHIAPAFDGTIRKIGRGAHGVSREQYNANLQPLLDHYLALSSAGDWPEALTGDLHALARTMTLVGRTQSVPKAVRLP